MLWSSCLDRRRRTLSRGFLLVPLLGLLLGSTGCLEDLIRSMINVRPLDAEPGMADAGPFEGAAPEHLTLDAVKPDHGPFTGDTELVIYGFGFTAETRVRIGGRAPQQGSFRVLSPVALELRTPAGEVGPAEVEIDNGKEVVRRPAGFTYDAVAIEPGSGPTSGGTLVSVLGRQTSFAEGITLSLGGKPLEQVEVVSPTLVRARTPAGTEGSADLTWSENGGNRIAQNAFTYYASANPKSGGMGGGPLAGSLTVNVLNWLDRKPLPGALVLVQRQRLYQAQAKTDSKGTAVFTHQDLQGPITVSAALPGFEATSIISFDARDLTIFLMPIPKPQPGGLPPGTLASIVEGYVLFGGPTGSGTPGWNLVPPPKAGQVKRLFVYATSAYLDWGPQTAGASATIDWKDDGATAWPYSLAVYPSSQAIYAVAGLYTAATNRFEPYAMGITRGVVAGPGEYQRVDVTVQIPLVEKIDVELKGLPAGFSKHQLRLAIWLGADGYILREDQEVSGDGLLGSQAFSRLPGFAHQQLLDATYTVALRLGSSSPTGLPQLRATQRSVLPVAGKIVIADFIGAPIQVKPAPGSTLAGNTLAWSHSGIPADLAVTSISLGDGTPVWRVISRGDITTVKLPDPASLGLGSWPSGSLAWTQWLARLPGFSFDSFTYSNLSSSTWDRWSTDEFELQVP